MAGSGWPVRTILAYPACGGKHQGQGWQRSVSGSAANSDGLVDSRCIVVRGRLRRLVCLGIRSLIGNSPRSLDGEGWGEEGIYRISNGFLCRKALTLTLSQREREFPPTTKKLSQNHAALLKSARRVLKLMDSRFRGNDDLGAVTRFEIVTKRPWRGWKAGLRITSCSEP